MYIRVCIMVNVLGTLICITVEMVLRRMHTSWIDTLYSMGAVVNQGSFVLTNCVVIFS